MRLPNPDAFKLKLKQDSCACQQDHLICRHTYYYAFDYKRTFQITAARPQLSEYLLNIHTMPGHLIRRLNQISVALFAEKTAAAGLTLTPVQFAALSAVQDHPGIDQATVAGLVAYDRATLGKVIDRLEARDLLIRTTSRKDRRARELTLTDSGTALLQAARPVIAAFQPEILGGLSPSEQALFVKLLEKATMAGNTLSRAPMIPIAD
jgi:DNA-binding MarR family transcriptional regulator